MKIYGYQKDKEDLLELKEVSILTTIKELETLINFLKVTKVEHSKIIDEVEMCHSHFKDWNVEFKGEYSDFIIVTSKE